MFWTGLADGGPFFGAFAAFDVGETNEFLGVAEDYSMTPQGGWNDGQCSQLHAYLCSEIAQ